MTEQNATTAQTRTVPLAKPIQAHGETLTALTLRRPTVKELRTFGAPYRLGNDSVRIDYEVCAKLISEICAIPPSTVDQMDGADFDEVSLILVGFTKRAPVAERESGSTAAV
jgi:hypothetical protein